MKQPSSQISTSETEPIPELGWRLKQNHYLIANGLMVFTEKFHLDRGSCCGSNCRHCPYEPRSCKGNTHSKLPELFQTDN